MNYTEQEKLDFMEKSFNESRIRIHTMLEKKNIKVNDIVAIDYETYSNCGMKKRRLNNLLLEEIRPGAFKFIQQGKKQKCFIISFTDIFMIYKQA